MIAIIMYCVREIANILNPAMWKDEQYNSDVYEALFCPNYDYIIRINRGALLTQIAYFRKEISRLEQLGDQEDAIKRVNEYITILGRIDTEIDFDGLPEEFIVQS